MKAYQPDAGSPRPMGLDDVREYLPFVRRVALRIARRLPSHVRLDELVGAGVLGLVEARARFDATRAIDFQKFAEFRVKGAILDELRRRDVMPRDARISAKKLERRIGALAQSLGREPSEEEIASDLQVSVDELRSTLEKLTPVRVVALSDDEECGDAAVSVANPFDDVAREQMRRALSAAITRLSQRHQQVLHLYYQEELTMREIGEVLQVTESRVCQIVSEATLKLRALLAPRGGRDGDGDGDECGATTLRRGGRDG